MRYFSTYSDLHVTFTIFCLSQSSKKCLQLEAINNLAEEHKREYEKQLKVYASEMDQRALRIQVITDCAALQALCLHPEIDFVSLLLGVSGMVLLVTSINLLTAWLTLFALIGYAVVYTMFSKRLMP